MLRRRSSLILDLFYCNFILFVGAGRYPTANSVVNDIIRLAQEKTLDAFPLERDLTINNDFIACFYVRITCQDGLGIIKSVGEAAESTGVSIHAILQNPILNPKILDFVVTTEPVKLSQVTAFVRDLARRPFAITSPIFFPILSS